MKSVGLAKLFMLVNNYCCFSGYDAVKVATWFRRLPTVASFKMQRTVLFVKM
jgi:hypothetical protein